MSYEQLSTSQTQVSRLIVRVEHNQSTLGIGTPCPRLSWIIETNATNWLQTAYEIECYTRDGQIRGRTGWIHSPESVLVPWPFEPLTSREQVLVRVRVRDNKGDISPWSEMLPIEMGLLKATDWNAQFITPDWNEDISKPQPCPMLRQEFRVEAEVIQARLYITSLGVYEAQINGVVVGDQVLAPGWTVYDRRLRYQTFDVTALLRQGANAIGVIVGDGWFRGRLGFGGGRRNIYGNRLAVLAQLEITYRDGSTQQIITDHTWRATTGPILASDIYDGEIYDARLELLNWSMPGFADHQWSGVRFVEWDFNTLVASTSPPVRRIEVLKPVAIFSSPSGRTLVDFGQNLVGRVRLTVNGPSGQVITVRHAEVLEYGELCTRPLRFAAATDRYILRGGGTEIWEPRFTFHGFRYVEIDGWPGELRATDIVAVVLHSDMERIGWFTCSDQLINRFHENVVWSMRGNFLDVPTDCPQRDERLGWTGDIQVFAPTAAFLYDVAGFLQSWLVDLAIEQEKLGGSVPFVVPNVLGPSAAGAAAWGDAATVVPWVLFQRYGDRNVLEMQYKSMRAWVDYVATRVSHTFLWDRGFQFGDWLDPTAPPDKPEQARTDKAIIATAYFIYSATLVARAANVLGYEADVALYAALAHKARTAFAQEYITPSGRLMGDTETAYALALVFDLFPTDAQRRYAGERLAALVRDSGYHIRTGFVGTPLICDALCLAGHHRVAYRLLKQRECPSWLYPVTMGATTIWERWDSMLPDGSINPGEMTSFNHYALGAVADWMHRTIGGLIPLEPGYRRIEFRPQPGGGITFARVSHRTPYGLAECFWRIEDGVFHMSIVVPPNTTARVFLPGSSDKPLEVGSGFWQWSVPYREEVNRGPYTVDDSVDDILDDAAAREVVYQVLSQIENVNLFGNVLLSERSMSLREAVRALPNSETIIARLNELLIHIPERR
ncbi:MAG: alpha-L-rhamnosidase [Chloroflexus sp.]|nr:MAG: alpha-L-rhamnosidase [Chloroflexus sp.]